MTFQCALDGTAYSSCTSPEQYSDLLRGVHTLRVRAVDAFGNADPTPATFTWRVDLPPVVALVTFPEEVTEQTQVTFEWVSDVPGATFECWLDGAADGVFFETIAEARLAGRIFPCSTPFTRQLEYGQHYFAVLATSPWGTEAESWEEYEFVVGHTQSPLTYITEAAGPRDRGSPRRVPLRVAGGRPRLRRSPSGARSTAPSPSSASRR